MRKFLLCLSWCIGLAAISERHDDFAQAAPKAQTRVASATISTKNVGSELSISAADRRVIQQLLRDAQPYASFRARLNYVSQRLLGIPYLSHPLIGSSEQPEQFVTRLDGFDCVTYLETVLALAGARDVESYLQRLRWLRYQDGEINYTKRLHYTTDWHRANVERGFLQDLTKYEGSIERTKTLSRVAGVEPHAQTFRYYPKAKFNMLLHWLQEGDLIYFVSGRQGLDTNHVGIVFRSGETWMMRHATRNRGRVTEQPLAEFVQQNLMLGFMLARPIG